MALTIKIIRFDHGSERRAIEKFIHVELIPSIYNDENRFCDCNLLFFACSRLNSQGSLRTPVTASMISSHKFQNSFFKTAAVFFHLLRVEY